MPLYNNVIERVTKDKEEDTRPRLLSRPFDAASEGISNAWNALPEPVKEGATNTANFIRNVFIDDPGSEWNQAILKKVLTNVEGEEVGLQKFNALNESIARGDHDPIGQVFGAAIEGVSQVPTAVGLPPLDTRATRTGLALYTLGKIPMVPRTSKLYQSRIPVNKRIVNVNAQAIDDIFTMPPADFQAITRLAKQSGINSMTLARRFNEQKGILKTYLQSKGRYGPLEDTKDLKGMATTGGDDFQSWVTSQKLQSDPVNKFLLGESTKLPKDYRALIQNAALGEVTDANFKGLTPGTQISQYQQQQANIAARSSPYIPYQFVERIDELIAQYPERTGRLQGIKGSFLWNEHHLNPKTAPIDFYVGRTDIADREIIRDLLVDEFRIFSGNSPLNRISLPTGMEDADVHALVHEWLAPRIGERADVLKAKWAKEAGLKLGPLQTRTGATGYLAGQQFLSNTDREIWNNYMSQLPVDGKLMKRYIREYGAIIKESEGVINQLMAQFDAFYKVPEGSQIELSPDLLVKVLDEIDPTTQPTLPVIERIIREVVQDEKLNLINPQTNQIVGVAQKSQRELDLLFRSDDLLSMLDAANQPGWTGTNRQIMSWANELNQIYIELGLFPKGQLSLNIGEGQLGTYLNKARQSRFGNVKTVLTDIDRGLPATDEKLNDIANEAFPDK